jgi:triosephosphate isomerase
MRKKIVAANWKMNLNLAEGAELVSAICKSLPELDEHKQVIIAPPFIHLSQTGAQLATVANVSLAAQNCHHEASGAYTGEVAASMLSAAGVGYVIVGHSERRQYFAEINAVLAQKTNQVLANNMDVVYCCGEPLEVRDAGGENEYVTRQLEEGIFHLSAQQMKNIVIAYEPIWAIGTGRTASTAQAQDMHAHIRSVLKEKYGQEVAESTSILYGGSCKPSNAVELFSCADVDGGLIGGASLKAEEFLGIINAMM